MTLLEQIDARIKHYDDLPGMSLSDTVIRATLQECRILVANAQPKNAKEAVEPFTCVGCRHLRHIVGGICNDCLRQLRIEDHYEKAREQGDSTCPQQRKN